ncbi:hypothetical protein JDFR1000234_26 [uncultured archaeal virus]|uniref:Uncharacterized protein n=1 Tax=uncultured archaeal virus TaxID=1960247 RepID=A0A1S5Y313_9VIRU|nr:hypothetical protein JDFR1000234_26 [uncultured archaeal virus]
MFYVYARVHSPNMEREVTFPVFYLAYRFKDISRFDYQRLRGDKRIEAFLGKKILTDNFHIVVEGELEPLGSWLEDGQIRHYGTGLIKIGEEVLYSHDNRVLRRARFKGSYTDSKKNTVTLILEVIDSEPRLTAHI